MNAFGHLKKIFNSFDFMGNRIKRLRVDTPENFIDDKNPDKEANPIYREDLEGNTPDVISENLNRGVGTKYNEKDYDCYKDFVANKDYVDKSVNYNTEVAKNQELGNNIESKEPIGYDLIDGRPGPEKITIYENGNDKVEIVPKRTPSQFPWLGNVFGLNIKEIFDKLLYPRIPYKYKYPEITNIQIKTDNFLIECLEQYGKSNKFLLNENVENNIYFDIHINAGDWFDTESAEIWLYDTLNNIYKLYSTHGPTHVVSNNKINSLPKNIVKVEFHQRYSHYIQHYDTWGYESNPYPIVHDMVVDITDEFFKQCYIWNIKQKTTGNDYSFIKEVSIISSNNHNIIELKIPEFIVKDYYLKYYIYDYSHKLLNTGYISQNEINSDGTIKYNFGTYPESIYIKFKPVPVTTLTGFTQND